MELASLNGLWISRHLGSLILTYENWRALQILSSPPKVQMFYVAWREPIGIGSTVRLCLGQARNSGYTPLSYGRQKYLVNCKYFLLNFYFPNVWGSTLTKILLLLNSLFA